MERNVEIIHNEKGESVVLIHDILFKGKRKIKWEDVEQYLKKFIGESCIIEENSERIYIGAELPDEFCWSGDTKRLMGALAKAKANSVQAIPELIQIASNESYTENYKDKHSKDAKFGWYRYDTRFALPVYDEDGKIEKYNVFKIRMLIRHASNGKKYLYDMVNIKKETSKPL